ncbi:hypothetical protein RvY_11295-3 [Ramazzottius varieornatus]|uniref:MIF4G domain-containing protein n=1 Tax=Ramazzottius varieornatus TaxID=947166 RepID=A0A1D1VPI0_RAMVA|nr:hypothetical protein RvY_11295-3 [Ramazzottius varieornatus]
MAANQLQQRRIFRKTPTDNCSRPGSEEIEKLKYDVYELLDTLDEGTYREVASQMVRLHIAKSYGHLEAAVGAIIETALYYPDYTKLYARFCHILSSKSVEVDCKKPTQDVRGGQPQKHTFHDAMVYRTQQQFASARTEYEELTTQSRPAELSAHHKMLFMADLYTAGVMVNSVMLSNFATIIYTSEQVALECLCRLMSAFIEKNKCSASHLKVSTPKSKPVPQREL